MRFKSFDLFCSQLVSWASQLVSSVSRSVSQSAGQPVCGVKVQPLFGLSLDRFAITEDQQTAFLQVSYFWDFPLVPYVNHLHLNKSELKCLPYWLPSRCWKITDVRAEWMVIIRIFCLAFLQFCPTFPSSSQIFPPLATSHGASAIACVGPAWKNLKTIRLAICGELWDTETTGEKKKRRCNSGN